MGVWEYAGMIGKCYSFAHANMVHHRKENADRPKYSWDVLPFLLLGFSATRAPADGAICANAKLRQYIEEAGKLFGPKDADGQPRKLCLRRSTARRTIMRQALVQTASIHVVGAQPLRETVFCPPRLVATTSAAIVLTALLNIFESLFTLGVPFLLWLRECPFRKVLLIITCDQASYNGLVFKFLMCLQWMLLPSIVLFLWLEPCGLHMGARVLVGHMDRYKIRKVLQACSRSLKEGKSHDRLVDVIPKVVEARARFRKGTPPADQVHASANPIVKTLLLNLWLLNERQRTVGHANADAFEQSELKFHFEAILALLNITLVGDFLWHWCEGCCTSEIQFKQKLTYHLISILNGGMSQIHAVKIHKDLRHAIVYLSIANTVPVWGYIF